MLEYSIAFDQSDGPECRPSRQRFDAPPVLFAQGDGHYYWGRGFYRKKPLAESSLNLSLSNPENNKIVTFSTKHIL